MFSFDLDLPPFVTPPHLPQGRKEPGAALLKKTDASPEEQAKDLEKKVHEILEQSALMTKKEDFAGGD